MLSLTIKTRDVMSGRNKVDPHEQLRGKWVEDQIASFQLKETVVVLKCPVC